MKLGIIIQARIASTRLPNKILLPFYKNLTILDLLIQRLQKYLSIPIILATSTNPSNDILLNFANKYKIPLFRGSEEDVLQRFIDCSREYGFDGIIRICSDNPFISIIELETLIRSISENEDYISATFDQVKPTIQEHIGIYPEYITFTALKKISELTTEPCYREHVTNYAYGNPDIFKIKLIKVQDPPQNIRLTVDTKQDFQYLKEVWKQFSERDYDDRIKIGDLIELLSEDGNSGIIEMMESEIKKNQK